MGFLSWFPFTVLARVSDAGLCYRFCMASPRSRPEGVIAPPLRRETSLAEEFCNSPN
jgi:hypothetical protein